MLAQCACRVSEKGCLRIAIWAKQARGVNILCVRSLALTIQIRCMDKVFSFLQDTMERMIWESPLTNQVSRHLE